MKLIAFEKDWDRLCRMSQYVRHTFLLHVYKAKLTVAVNMVPRI